MAIRLESGPARTDTIWVLSYTLLCLGLGAWFFKDWKIGYPEKNRADAVQKLTEPMKQLTPPRTPPNPLPTKPRKADFDALVQSEKRTLEGVNEMLGPPLFELVEPDTVMRYYASEFGMVSIPFKSGLAQISPQTAWRTWYKSEDEVEAQKYFAVLCGVVGLYFIYRTIRAATLHVTLDDSEMNYGGLRIPTAAMKRLTDYSRKGWVDLYYDLGAGERKLRLDNQKVAKFDEIIVALCALKGFPDPRQTVETDESAPAT